LPACTPNHCSGTECINHHHNPNSMPTMHILQLDTRNCTTQHPHISCSPITQHHARARGCRWQRMPLVP
jgi:hypothetical protein